MKKSEIECATLNNMERVAQSSSEFAQIISLHTKISSVDLNRPVINKDED